MKFYVNDINKAVSHLKETRTCVFCSYVHSMNRMNAYLRNCLKIKFRIVSVQHLINEAPDVTMPLCVWGGRCVGECVC